MTNKLILYKSKYGTTQKYAEALARQLSCPVLSVQNARKEDLALADIIIIGGHVVAMGLGFGKFVKAHADVLKDKRLLFFAVGASPTPDTGDLQALRQRSLGTLFADAPLFYCRGAWDMESMTLVDRTLCKALLKSIQKKDANDLKPWEKALRSAGNKKTSWYDEKHLQPLLDAVTSLAKP